MSEDLIKVTNHPSRDAYVKRRGQPSGSVDGGGGGGDDGIVNERVAALEARLDAVLPTLAGKEDIANVRADIKQGILETHRWMIGTVIGLFLGFGGLFLAMSNALKPIGQSQPSVVILSGQAAGTAAAAAASGSK